MIETRRRVPGRRQERLADQIHVEVAEMIEGELKDPRIGFATVTRVEMSPDLRQAKIWVSTLGGEDERKDALAGLLSASGYVRRELGQRLRLRYSPQISFLPDRGAEEAVNVESLLQKLHDERNNE